MIDTERNKSAYLQLVEVVRAQRALAFAGAGVTAPLGYPDWDGLIARLAQEVRMLRGENIQSNGQSISVREVLDSYRNKPLVQAQILKENLGEKYFEVMMELFGPGDRRLAAIADLVNLPFKHILTSNYDIELEKHHDRATRPESICLHHASAPLFITSFGDDSYKRTVVHVHGRYNEPRNIILTEDDYGIYVRSAVYEQFWRTVPVAVRLVFFGFSFRDLDLLYGFRRARMALQVAGQNLCTRHFAVMALEDVSKEATMTLALRMEYGIEPVFFLRHDKSFSGYDVLLAKLRADVAGPTAVTLAQEESFQLQGQPREVGEAAALIEEVPEAAVLQGVRQLRRISRDNIARRQTGDLQ